MAILKTTPYMFANLNWKDIEQLMKKERFLLLLPLGSTEPHGPHCPLSTDITISSEVCLRVAQKLHNLDCEAYVLPPLAYSIAKPAESFPGCISISKETDSSLISEVALSFIHQGIEKICLFNSHFDPLHISAIYDAIDLVNLKTGVNLLFTDITQKKYSARLTDAFKEAGHADRYETSLIMAIDPGLVNEVRRKRLEYLPIDLVQKIFKEGITDFRDMGLDQAYCGDPASASVEEGEEVLELLSSFIIEDIENAFIIHGDSGRPSRGLYGRFQE